MDAGLIVVALIALAVGGLIGWLLGSRGAGEGKATAESLRMQLDGVVKERDEARDQIGPLNA
jgi:DNA recombination protein RmuC